jgi:hypothetical protein
MFDKQIPHMLEDNANDVLRVKLLPLTVEICSFPPQINKKLFTENIIDPIRQASLSI